METARNAKFADLLTKILAIPAEMVAEICEEIQILINHKVIPQYAVVL
jgi:hypothetical protein